MIQENDEKRDLRLHNKLQMQREILNTRLFLLFYTFKLVRHYYVFISPEIVEILFKKIKKQKNSPSIKVAYWRRVAI